MSGEGEVEDVIAALRLGAVDYLRKPWSTAEFTDALGRAIDVYQALSVGETAEG
ncbi:MAG: hypothetical protein ABIS92_05380 [Polyangia bacterium]